MPGWLNGTVGYHIDDGKIFDAENPTWGKEYEGEIIINKNSWTRPRPFTSLSSNPFVGEKNSTKIIAFNNWFSINIHFPVYLCSIILSRRLP